MDEDDDVFDNVILDKQYKKKYYVFKVLEAEVIENSRFHIRTGQVIHFDQAVNPIMVSQSDEFLQTESVKWCLALMWLDRR